MANRFGIIICILAISGCQPGGRGVETAASTVPIGLVGCWSMSEHFVSTTDNANRVTVDRFGMHDSGKTSVYYLAIFSSGKYAQWLDDASLPRLEITDYHTGSIQILVGDSPMKCKFMAPPHGRNTILRLVECQKDKLILCDLDNSKVFPTSLDPIAREATKYTKHHYVYNKCDFDLEKIRITADP